MKQWQSNLLGMLLVAVVLLLLVGGIAYEVVKFRFFLTGGRCP